jgi:hypothetical protein
VKTITMAEWNEARVASELRRLGATEQKPHLEETWLACLEPDDAELVLLRLRGTRWKPICWRLGIARATAHRRWKAALRRIAIQLNGDAPTNVFVSE